MSVNLIAHVEIPVADLERAAAFYERAFGFALERTRIDGYPMALFPFHAGAPGASGALVQGDVYLPAKAGPIVYLAVPDVPNTLEAAVQAGGKLLYAAKRLDDGSTVGEFEDSEGNRIAVIARAH